MNQIIQMENNRVKNQNTKRIETTGNPSVV